MTDTAELLASLEDAANCMRIPSIEATIRQAATRLRELEGRVHTLEQAGGAMLGRGTRMLMEYEAAVKRIRDEADSILKFIDEFPEGQS